MKQEVGVLDGEPRGQGIHRAGAFHERGCFSQTAKREELHGCCRLQLRHRWPHARTNRTIPVALGANPIAIEEKPERGSFGVGFGKIRIDLERATRIPVCPWPSLDGPFDALDGHDGIRGRQRYVGQRERRIAGDGFLEILARVAVITDAAPPYRIRPAKKEIVRFVVFCGFLFKSATV